MYFYTEDSLPTQKVARYYSFKIQYHMLAINSICLINWYINQLQRSSIEFGLHNNMHKKDKAELLFPQYSHDRRKLTWEQWRKPGRGAGGTVPSNVQGGGIFPLNVNTHANFYAY